MDGIISVNGNIENNLKITFRETIEELLRQKQSHLSNTPAVYTAPFSGRVLGIVRSGGVKLKEATKEMLKYREKNIYLIIDGILRKDGLILGNG